MLYHHFPWELVNVFVCGCMYRYMDICSMIIYLAVSPVCITMYSVAMCVLFIYMCILVKHKRSYVCAVYKSMAAWQDICMITDCM